MCCLLFLKCGKSRELNFLDVRAGILAFYFCLLLYKLTGIRIKIKTHKTTKTRKYL